MEIELLYQRLTKIVEVGKEPINTRMDCTCSYCGRKPETFDFKGVNITNKYKQEINMCAACNSFFVDNAGVMGWKSPANPGAGNKFGMLSGCGALIECKEGGQTVFFAPPGIVKKLPVEFFDLFKKENKTLEEITAPVQIEWIIKQKLSYPLLWINDFGRKTDHLIKNLQFSDSPERLIPCSDKILNATNKANRIINLDTINKASKALNLLPSKDKNLFINTIGFLTRGQITPAAAGDVFQKNASFKKILQLLPSDPHLRQNILPLLKKIKPPAKEESTTKPKAKAKAKKGEK